MQIVDIINENFYQYAAVLSGVVLLAFICCPMMETEAHKMQKNRLKNEKKK